MIHQPFRLFEGSLMAFLGVFSLVQATTSWRKRQMTGRYGVWVSLAIGTFWTVDAISHGSEAFDWPHLESHRTHLIDLIGAIVCCAVVVPSLVAAWLAHRREKGLRAENPSPQDVGGGRGL